MALCIIADANDNVLTHKPRASILPEDIYRVSALWITSPEGRVLLAQRSFNKKNSPGKWGPAVAGTVEEGETYKMNILKEAQEELGITGIQFVEITKVLVQEPEGRYFAQWYHVALPEDYPFVLQQEEVEAVRWITLDLLRQELQNSPEHFIASMNQVPTWARFL